MSKENRTQSVRLTQTFAENCRSKIEEKTRDAESALWYTGRFLQAEMEGSIVFRLMIVRGNKIYTKKGKKL